MQETAIELSQFQTGQIVKISCPQERCKRVDFEATLGTEYRDRLSFRNRGKEGRIAWRQDTPMRTFGLQSEVACPKCGRHYRTVIIISNGPKAEPHFCAREF